MSTLHTHASDKLTALGFLSQNIPYLPGWPTQLKDDVKRGTWVVIKDDTKKAIHHLGR